jgi:hypothetical protein
MFNLSTASVAQIQAEITRLKALGAGTMHLRVALAQRSAGVAAPAPALTKAVRKDCKRMALELLRK